MKILFLPLLLLFGAVNTFPVHAEYISLNSKDTTASSYIFDTPDPIHPVSFKEPIRLSYVKSIAFDSSDTNTMATLYTWDINYSLDGLLDSTEQYVSQCDLETAHKIKNIFLSNGHTTNDTKVMVEEKLQEDDSYEITQILGFSPSSVFRIK